MSADSAFVFAVCGPAAELERAAFAVRALRRQGARRIVVVTDPARNRGRALPEGVEIVELSTPSELGDAAAAILLKTSVADAVAGEGPHAYLDSDVVAISPDIGRIFDDYVAPVTFASDLPTPQSNLRTFSSHAVDCPCAAERDRLVRHFTGLDSLTALHAAYDELAPLADAALYRGASFTGERRRGAWWEGEATGGSAGGAIRFCQRFAAGQPVSIVYEFDGFAWRLEKQGEESIFRDPEGRVWRFVVEPSEEGNGHWEDDNGDSLRRFRGADGEERVWYRGGAPRRRWQADPAVAAGGAWVDVGGEPLGECDHLAERLEALFGISIADRNWVPWNGGVFLFSPASRAFLADWRERCRAIFAAPGFRLRDQGALIATVWAAGLERHPRLPERDNRLVDARSAAARTLRLEALCGAGVRLLHFIGGGLDDAGWLLARDIADDLSRTPAAGAAPLSR